MIPITKRIRSNKALRIIEREQSAQPILDVGCGDGYFVLQARSKGIKITGVDPDAPADNIDFARKSFYAVKKTSAKTVTALALLWHTPPRCFFRKCKQLKIQEIVVIQGNPKLEWLTRMYSIGHKHLASTDSHIIQIAEEYDFKHTGYERGLLWSTMIFKK